MYYATGLPGWMRFGFSPGWVGRSPTGLGPCATYLTTGAWPVPQTGTYPGRQMPLSQMGRNQELVFLKQQAEWLSAQVEAIGKRIEEIEKTEER
jgi:hypothetical protein